MSTDDRSEPSELEKAQSRLEDDKAEFAREEQQLKRDEHDVKRFEEEEQAPEDLLPDGSAIGDEDQTEAQI